MQAVRAGEGREDLILETHADVPEAPLQAGTEAKRETRLRSNTNTGSRPRAGKKNQNKNS